MDDETNIEIDKWMMNTISGTNLINTKDFIHISSQDSFFICKILRDEIDGCLSKLGENVLESQYKDYIISCHKSYYAIYQQQRLSVYDSMLLLTIHNRIGSLELHPEIVLACTRQIADKEESERDVLSSSKLYKEYVNTRYGNPDVQYSYMYGLWNEYGIITKEARRHLQKNYKVIF